MATNRRFYESIIEKEGLSLVKWSSGSRHDFLFCEGRDSLTVRFIVSRAPLSERSRLLKNFRSNARRAARLGAPRRETVQ